MPARRRAKRPQPNRAAAAAAARIAPFSPPYGRGHTAPPGPARKPLLNGIDGFAGPWNWSDHALQQCAERGIGVYEVLSALYAPEWTSPQHSDRVRIVRGDLEVIYHPTDRVIITVIDRLEDHRDTPRQPLHPPITITAPTPPAPPPAPLSAEETPMPATHPTPPEGTAVEEVRAHLAALPAGTPVPVGELITMLGDRHASSAVRMAVRVAVDRGLAARAGRGLIQTTQAAGTGPAADASNVAATREPAAAGPDTLPPGPPAVADTDPPPPATTGKVTTTFAFTDPPTPPTPPSERDVTLAHITALVVRLKENPGMWAHVLIIEGSRQSAAVRVAFLRRHFDADLEFKTAPLPDTDGRRHGIYARYRGR
jgi:hypothetical protein